MVKVNDFKEKESDKYELGIAKKNAAIIMSGMIASDTKTSFSYETYEDFVEELFKKGKEIRKKILGY